MYVGFNFYNRGRRLTFMETSFLDTKGQGHQLKTYLKVEAYMYIEGV
jgi:hypothetical protein